jgi:hypothetical protein
MCLRDEEGETSLHFIGFKSLTVCTAMNETNKLKNMDMEEWNENHGCDRTGKKS